MRLNFNVQMLSVDTVSSNWLDFKFFVFYFLHLIVITRSLRVLKNTFAAFCLSRPYDPFSYLRRLFPVVVFLLRLFGSLLVENGFVGFGQFGSLLAADGECVVSLVPLAEWRGVDGDDGVLHEGLGSDQLVVAGVVDGVDDTRLAGDRLGTPREVAGVQPETEKNAVCGFVTGEV